ncbi:MAG: DUF3987 domain-containing protein [Patescibacteria group bacterium]|nr:DUF3987 domain-containing protein [Patescibacteria group bacterium]
MPDETMDAGYWSGLATILAPPTPAPDEPDTPRIFDPWAVLEPPGPFPMAALPPVLRAFVTSRSAVVGADRAALAWSAISACSAAVDARIRLRMQRHHFWTVPAAIWAALIGAPSTKKTPAIDAAWAPLQAIQGRDLGGHNIAVAEWKSLPKEERARVPEPSPPRRLVTHDATMEAMQELLSKQDRGIGVLRDELAGWIGSMEKYAPGKGSAADRAFWLQCFNGGHFVADRVQRGTVVVNNLLATICGGIQPDRLRDFRNLTDDGLWQRFVPVILAPATIGADEPPDDTVEAYAVAIESLLRLPLTTYELAEPAHLIREDVARRIFELESLEVLGPRFAGFLGKLVGLWGRLALVFHVLTDPDKPMIGRSCADAAATLLWQAVIPHAARVYTAMGAGGQDFEAVQSVAGYILTKRLDRFTMSEMTSNVRVCRGRSADDVRKLLSPLEAGGWISPEREWQPNSWAVSAFVHARFAAQAEREAQRREQGRALIMHHPDGEDEWS